MEADFQRDYGISLIEQMDTMSWRRFTALYRNLSGFGATASRVEELRKRPPEDGEETDTERKRGAEAFFADMLSTAR